MAAIRNNAENMELRRLCRRMSALTSVLALVSAVSAALWTGDNAWLMLAGGVLLFSGVAALLDALSIIATPAKSGVSR